MTLKVVSTKGNIQLFRHTSNSHCYLYVYIIVITQVFPTLIIAISVREKRTLQSLCNQINDVF